MVLSLFLRRVCFGWDMVERQAKVGLHLARFVEVWEAVACFFVRRMADLQASEKKR